MNPIDAIRPRLRCYTANSCWMQDTGDPGGPECPPGTCHLWDTLDDDAEVTEVLTVAPREGAVVA